MSSTAHISTLFSVYRDRGGCIHSLKSASLKKEKHPGCMDRLIFRHFNHLECFIWILHLCCALSCCTWKRGNLPQLSGNTCLHSQGICNSSRPRKQSASVSGFNCAVTLTAKRSTDVNGIKPVSPDAIGQACEAKGRSGEKRYAPAAPGLFHQDILHTLVGKKGCRID